MVEASNYATIVNWEILEAIRGLVIDGKYVVNSNGDFTEIDVIAEKCVADIKAKLQEYIASKHVPACLEGFVKPEEAVKNYEKALAFIDKYGHAFISNGAFFVEKYDAANNSLILSATSDEGYPFAKGEFAKRYTTSFARINQVKVGEFKKGADLNVTITVAEVAFPANTAKAAAKANVKLSLVGDKDYVYQGKAAKAGVYTVTIPAKDIEGLKAGTYTLVAEAALGTEAGAVSTAKLIVQ
jgi:peptide/nickel transport system substrate-binding protein